MPGRTDLYFPVADSEIEISHMKNAKLKPFESIYGHFAPSALNPVDHKWMNKTLKELLAS